MSHYEQRLADDKAALRERVVALGQKVVAATTESVAALLVGDRARSYQLVLDDLPINRESRAIDRACHAFVARHLPSAGHLRFVSSVMRMNLELERVGDYAVSICRQAVQLSRPPQDPIAQEIRHIADDATRMLRDALSAFATRDAELARETKPVAKSVGANYERVYREITETGTHDVRDIAALLAVFSKLERVTDQAKNVCEETLFELTGETKPAKRYRILFVDARNSMVSPLAELLARKGFPDSGQYASAGYQPADELAPELIALTEKLGIDVGDLKPTALDVETLSRYHVVVWLNGDPARVVERMPYETVLLQWSLPKLADGESASQQLHAISQALRAEIRDLMTTLRGEEAG